MLQYRLRQRDRTHHESEIAGINAQVSKLIARRATHEKALREMGDD